MPHTSPARGAHSRLAVKDVPPRITPAVCVGRGFRLGHRPVAPGEEPVLPHAHQRLRLGHGRRRQVAGGRGVQVEC